MTRQLLCLHDIKELSKTDFTGWTFQLLCHRGSCRFMYANREFSFEKDCDIVITAPERFEVIETSHDLEVCFVIGKNSFVNSRMPANHFGVGGNFMMYENPVLRLNPEQARMMSEDFRRVAERIDEIDNPFYLEMISSLMLTLIYDSYLVLYNRDRDNNVGIYPASIVERLIILLQNGMARRHRDVSYYAEQLNVTQKYLSDTVRRQSGHSVTYLINQYAIPLLTECLRNERMSLAQIAEEFSFSSVSYLSRYIKKHYGMTATEYRASVQPHAIKKD